MDPILSYIGYYGPYILFLLSLLFVFPQKILFLYTILGFIANQSINSTFKHVLSKNVLQTPLFILLLLDMF